jgi:hypothetical protein
MLKMWGGTPKNDTTEGELSYLAKIRFKKIFFLFSVNVLFEAKNAVVSHSQCSSILYVQFTKNTRFGIEFYKLHNIIFKF